jgi:hypothetical protein
MKKEFILLTAIVLMISCTTPRKIPKSEYTLFKIDKNELEEIKNKVIFTQYLNNYYYIPVDNRTTFILSSDKTITIYIKWFNLKKDEYVIQYDWIGSDEKIFYQSVFAFQPIGYSWNTWSSYTLSKVVTPIGKGRVNVYLNNTLYDNYTFEIKNE